MRHVRAIGYCLTSCVAAHTIKSVRFNATYVQALGVFALCLLACRLAPPGINAT